MESRTQHISGTPNGVTGSLDAPQATSSPSAPLTTAPSASAPSAPSAPNLTCLALHGPAFMWFLRVWLWHLGPQAALLPGAVGFGWFFQYMTFWGFTLQTLTLAVCILDDCYSPSTSTSTSPTQPLASSSAAAPGRRLARPRRPRLTVLADDLSCISFSFAHVVTVMYYVVNMLTKGGADSETSVFRPAWLSPTTHQLNSLVVWLDLALSQSRSFSSNARMSCCGFAAAYITWILLCREVNNRFPYPFLNALPFPEGFLLTAAASILVFVLFFQIGSTVNAGMRWFMRTKA